MGEILTKNGSILIADGDVLTIEQSSGGSGYFTVTDTTDTAGGTIRTITPIAGTPIIQNSKSVTINSNTTTTIIPDTGNTAIGQVVVTTNVSGGGGATEYVLNSTRHPIMDQLVFDLTSAGLTSADLVLDGKTFFWLEATANAVIECWEDGEGDDTYNVTIPSGTKFMCCQINTCFYFAGTTTSTYGFMTFSIDDSISGTEYLNCELYGDFPSSGGFVNGIGRNVKGCPGTLLGYPVYPWELHVVKLS